MSCPPAGARWGVYEPELPLHAFHVDTHTLVHKCYRSQPVFDCISGDFLLVAVVHEAEDIGHLPATLMQEEQGGLSILPMTPSQNDNPHSSYIFFSCLSLRFGGCRYLLHGNSTSTWRRRKHVVTLPGNHRCVHALPSLTGLRRGAADETDDATL